MAEPNIGEQVYREFVDAGQRSRFLYDDVQVLKSIETVDELRQLCETVSGKSLPADATPFEMVSACVVREPDQSDAQAMFGIGVDVPEGCLLTAVTLPFLFVGFHLGRLLRWVGLDLKQIGTHHLAGLQLVTAAVLAFTCGLAIFLESLTPIWVGTASGITAGVIEACRVRSARGLALLILWLTLPPTAGLVTMELIGQLTLWPALSYLVAMGTGYGMCRTQQELFEVKRGQPINDGFIVLHHSTTSD